MAFKSNSNFNLIPLTNKNSILKEVITFFHGSFICKGGDKRQALNSLAIITTVNFLQFTLLLIKGGCNA